jgi:hypothetical protein
MKHTTAAGLTLLAVTLGVTATNRAVTSSAQFATPSNVHGAIRIPVTPVARDITPNAGAAIRSRPPAPHPRGVLPNGTASNGASYRPVHSPARLSTTMSDDALTAVVKSTCTNCHSDRRKQGNLSLESFDMATVSTESPEVAEKIIGKLRAGMMPPPGRKRPAGDTLDQLASSLERVMDARYASNPTPGSRAFQRLNRAEYERSIHDLLGLDIDASSWLPLDTKSANFDNIADAQMPSATLLDSYLDAASEISRLAVGDAKSGPTSQSYKVPRLASQLEPLEGAPRGTRGGVSVVHNFPADGEYTFAITLHAVPTGQLYGSAAPFDEQIEVSVNGARVALLDIDRGMSQADPDGMDITTVKIPVRAGPQRITATFLRTFEGPVNDVVAPIGHSIADTQIGAQSGVTILPHLQNFTVTGPFNATGVSDTPSRRMIFTCRPTTPAEARPCAERIIAQLGARAYRRPLDAADRDALMAFYDDGLEDGGFELGVRHALEAMLASPHFIFRIEEVPEGAKAGARVALDQEDLASRLSFFLWGAAPDSTLTSLARRGLLADTAMLVKQTRRMLADPRAEALATRFAAQWLRLQDIEKVHPDALQYPDFHGQLADAMRRETELFFYNLVRDNGSVLEMVNANYTYVNELLAKHYGMTGVVGSEFRKVLYPDNSRSGLLGHASVLTLTSHANRTSPVLRGKWVMEVLMGTPPPPPPPNVPDLEKVGEAKEGRMLTTRERMEAHRANASCNSCHQFIDPIGLALDNFDVTGRWRIRENGSPLDTRGDFYDGTAIASPHELQQVLLKRPTPLVRNFALNLMAYAVGRRMEYYDNPAIRRIEATAKTHDYRISDFIEGVVKSDAFRFKQIPVTQADSEVDAATTRSGR